jgi:hypothetical protein
MEATLVWLLEAMVGMLPLVAHYFIHIMTVATERPAMCPADLRLCRFMPDQPTPEICILAVVTAGISVIGALGFGHHFRRSELNALSYVLIFASGAACLVGFGMYAVASIGQLNGHFAWVTWWTLAAALASSFVLSIDKAVREPSRD